MEKEKTHWRKVFNSDYLGSCDLEIGQDLKAVIKSVSIQEVKGSEGKKQNCNVAVFTDSKIKPMILNATNCRTVKKFAGTPFIEDWKNIPVQIYVKDDIKAFGETTEGLRIRPQQPLVSKPKLRKDMPAWNNAVKHLKANKPIADIEKVYDLSEVREDLLTEAV